MRGKKQKKKRRRREVSCMRESDRERRRDRRIHWGLLIFFFKRDRSRQETEERDRKQIVKLNKNSILWALVFVKKKKGFVLLQLISVSISTKFNG